MTVLRGQFSIALIVEASDIEDGAVIEHALESVAKELELVVVVRPVRDGQAGEEATSHIAVSIHGSDHPGIVARIADVIASHNGNVIDLETRVIDADAGATYVMLLTVGLPASASLEALTEALRQAAVHLGVTCAVSPVDTELL